jgi:hypothetical protein
MVSREPSLHSLLLSMKNQLCVLMPELAKALAVLILYFPFLIALPPVAATAPMLLIGTLSIYALQRESVRSLSNAYSNCCGELECKRHQRDTLKRLLDHARSTGLSNWCEMFGRELMITRQHINRLFARRARIRRALRSAAERSTGVAGGIG